MTVSLTPDQRSMLNKHLCEIPEFLDTRSRRALVRDCLAGRDDGEKLTAQFAYEGSAVVFVSDLIDRLAHAAALEDGQQPLLLLLAHLDQGGYLNDAARQAFRALRAAPVIPAPGRPPPPDAPQLAVVSMTPERCDRLKALLEAVFKGWNSAARQTFVKDAIGRGHAALDDILESAWGQTPSVAADAVAAALCRYQHLPTPGGDDPVAAVSRQVRARKLDGNPDIRPHLEPKATDLSVSEGARPDPGAKATRNEAVFAHL